LENSLQLNNVKTKLKQGKTVVGSFLYIPSPKLAEFVGLCGFDFIVIDQEHGPIDIDRAEEMVRACELAGTTPLVRVGGLSSHPILQALDIGGMGVHIPSVNTADQAREAVRLCKYAPLGHRGLAGVRAAEYGLRGSLSDYCRQANQETLVIIHIEEMEAISNLDELLSVEGIDVYYLGPTDLSNSIGRPGSNDAGLSKIVDDAIEKIVQAGKVAGIITNDPGAARRYLGMGVRYMATHAVGLMATASRTFLTTLKN
jgi:4-hydroxy-2-oxoheptanedioate aldolase